jgi:two-component system, NtrC family, response regulator PilR
MLHIQKTTPALVQGRVLTPDSDSAASTLVYAPGSPLENVLKIAATVAPSSCPVFLRGESGSGKEMVARFLHQKSQRATGPFVPVNCAALPQGLIESELFGHRKGAFTGAHADSLGKFRLAHGGTLLLDEIGDMPLEVQTRLLRVLQEKVVSPVGDSHDYPVDFRLICATHRDLRRAVEEGKFREDLYYRLDVIQIGIPPLRERPQDIRPLVGHFLSRLLSPLEAEAALAAFPNSLINLPFPGNIRELRNMVERYAVMKELGWGWEAAAQGSVALEGASCIGTKGANSGVPATQIGVIRNSRVSDGEILRALSSCGHHRAKTSTLLGITRRALQYRLARMSLAN